MAPTGVKGTQHWAIFYSFPIHVSMELDWEWNSQDTNQCPDGMLVLQGSSLTQYTTVLAPLVTFSYYKTNGKCWQERYFICWLISPVPAAVQGWAMPDLEPETASGSLMGMTGIHIQLSHFFNLPLMNIIRNLDWKLSNWTQTSTRIRGSGAPS